MSAPEAGIARRRITEPELGGTQVTKEESMNTAMTKTLAAVVLGASVAAIGAIAAEEDHYKEGTAGVAPHDTSAFDERRMQQHNDQMEAHLKEMQALMDKLHQTKDPKERQRLLEEHRKQMHALHKQMRSTRDEMRMGMMGGGMRGGGPVPEGEKMRQHLIEKRLDMMDMMMDMMMQDQEMTAEK
jgi:hypothetical protein